MRQIILVYRPSLALSEHGTSDVEEAGDVGAVEVAARGAILFSDLIAGGVNVPHDLL
jgi:hypothetical protein